MIIGESMGGLVARYTTALMESPEYFNLFLDPCKPDLRHNTRLLLCYDSPHRGANVPLGIQMYYKHLAHLAYMFSGFNNGIADIYNNRLLNSISAKQMLVYHIETENNPLLLINSSTFTSSGLRAGLLNDFAALGNYPKFCKLGELSNGALDGSRQTREWDNSDRQPNDFILDLETDFYLRVLGFRFLGSYTRVQVRSNPNGTGSVFLLDKGISHPKIRLRWFGVRIDINHTTLLKVDKRARNVLPYCVSAGSHLGFGSPLTTMNNPIGQSGDLAHLLGLRYNMVINGQGEITFSGNLFSLLVPWMININLNGRAYSDGFDFAFIPLHSSFDYAADNPGNLDYDIHNDAVADIMDMTPFDMVITNPTDSNRLHLFVDNPWLAPYATCNDNAIRSHIIPREIGDDSLWLENYRFLPASMVVEAEQDIMINYRNPYYNYPSLGSSINNYTHTDRLHYIISKEEDINIPIPAGSPDKITFRANNGVWIAMGPYDITPGFMVLCCINFSQRPVLPPTDSTIQVLQSALEVYPNPVRGNTIMNVKYRFKENAPAMARISDMQGRLLYTTEMPFKDNTLESGFEIDLSKSNMQAGMYIIQISTKNEVLSKKFVIQP